MPPMSDEHERKEQQQRSAAWYAILGLGALTAAAAVVLRWLPNNPFQVPSELPNTTQLNARGLEGVAAPRLAMAPSQERAIGAGCRTSDVAMVQEWRNALRVTTTQSIMGWMDRAGARGARLDVVGWTAEGDDVDAGDMGERGCVVRFTVRDRRGPRAAAWHVSGDRTEVTPMNDLAREITALSPRRR